MKNHLSALLGLALALGCTSSASAVDVTFRINMSVQRAMGNFVPVDDLVYVAGNWVSGDWRPGAQVLSQSVTDTNIWEGTLSLNALQWYQYKFLMSRFGIGDVWEVNGVGAGGANNRWFQAPGTNTTLEVVFFNNLTEPPRNHAPVTFRVNMGVQIAQGSFDPFSGTVAVSGDAIDNWANAGTHFLFQSLAETNIWEGTFEITNNVGGTVHYKFIRNATWESIDDREFVMTNVAQILPAVYFNDVTNVAVPIPMTFSLNMGVAMARGAFNPGFGDYVEARGTFLTDAGNNWLGGFTLTNHPTNPILYSGTIINTNDGVGGTVRYQFVINGSTWEISGDRTHVVSETNGVSLPTVFLNNVGTLGTLTNTALSATSAGLSWEGGPLIRVQSSGNLSGPWQTIDGTEAQNAVTVPVGPDQTYFRLIGP
jgi:hypothetical protein